MKATVGQGKCGFCEIDRTINPVDLAENEHWRIFENAWPYPGHAFHLVAPAKTHWTNLADITDQGIGEALQLISAMSEKHRMSGGAIVLRFGDFIHHAGTLKHLHFQVQVPNELRQSFVTIGRPNAMQIDEAVAMLTGELTHTSNLIEIKRGEHWYITRDQNKRRHVLEQFRIQSHDFLCLPDFARLSYVHVEFLRLLKDLESKYKLPGAALVLQFGTTGILNKKRPLLADVIVASGTGPVFEILHPAANRLQAM